MPTAISRAIGYYFFFASLAVAISANADEAASNYLLAALELGGSVPDYVDSATTDHPETGFSTRLSDKQISYLKQPSVASALDRFDKATSFRECVWSRYSNSSWSSAQLNDRLHGLARVALLRARIRYEAGRWMQGNQSVDRVRIMARHMALQARPFEHQCFMIENMANGTAAAYLFQFPPAAIADLLERHRRVGVFSPKARMLADEADRFKMLAEDFDSALVPVDKLLEFVEPYLVTEADRRRFRDMSRTDAAADLRCLSSFLSEHSKLMEVDHRNAERQIANVYGRHASTCRLVAAFGEPPLGDYRENAQAICRGVMMAEVIKRLLGGETNFSTINDPYSSKPFGFRKNDFSFTLVSELKNPGHVDFQFGLAGPK